MNHKNVIVYISVDNWHFLCPNDALYFIHSFGVWAATWSLSLHNTSDATKSVSHGITLHAEIIAYRIIEMNESIYIYVEDNNATMIYMHVGWTEWLIQSGTMQIFRRGMHLEDYRLVCFQKQN